MSDTHDDETVILTRMTDTVQAGALRALLESEGISVATPGLEHRGLLGIAGGYVDIVVRVPRKDLARAEELLEALRTESPPSPSETAGDRPRTDRQRRVAMFAAFWLPLGGAHFYARRHRIAFALAALQIATLALALARPPFWYAALGIVVADAIGAVVYIGALQRGTRPSWLASAAPGLAILSLLAVPAVRALAPTLLTGAEVPTLCARAAACGAPVTEDACIGAAADRAMRGELRLEIAHACSTCVGDGDCDDLARCAACGEIVALPR